MPNKFYKKYIRIPPNESIDIRDIMPIIHHPLFQRLLHISQLGTTLNVFPGATHNRFEHALGVYGKTKRFTRRMVEDGFLTPFEAKNVSLFGLLHDIGHGPFSHVIEELTPLSGDEDENGLVVLKLLKNEINAAGGDYEFIRKIAAHKNPLYKIVMDKNVGMDKLDYLERDVYHTGFGQRPDIESLFNYLVYLKGNLVIDKKSLEAAKQMQKLYLYMYKEVYLHKSALISQRFLQKMIAMLMEMTPVRSLARAKGASPEDLPGEGSRRGTSAGIASGEATSNGMDPAELWRMNDKELIALVYTHPDKNLKFLYDCYKNRNFPSTGLVIRLKDKEFRERIAGKNIKVIGEEKKFFESFMKHTSYHDLDNLESKIAGLLKTQTHKIIIVPTLTPWRFVPEDILYHDNGRILSLKDTQKEYFEALKAEMSDYLAVRVCIVGDRGVIYKNSLKIYELIKKEAE